MKSLLFTLVFVSQAFLVGCATITQSSTETISIDTLPAGGTCDAYLVAKKAWTEIPEVAAHRKEVGLVLTSKSKRCVAAWHRTE